MSDDKTPVPVFRATWEQGCLKVLSDVLVERRKQEAKFGQQDLPDGTGGALFRNHSDWSKRQYEEAAIANRLTYRHVLREEVDEAFAESDEDKLIAELTQVAAVATKWIESIRRRQADRRQGR